MKKIIATVLAFALCAVFASPSFAAAYNYDFESGGDTLGGFGKSTSGDVPPATDPMSVNTRRNKDASALPPPYGIFGGEIPTDASSLYHANDTATYYPAAGASGGSAGSAASSWDGDSGGMLPPTSVYPGDSGSSTYTPPYDAATPVLTAGTGIRTGNTTATVQFYSSKAGRYYYTVVTDGATAPSVSTGGAGTSCAAGWITVNLSVTAGAKDVYVKVKDANGYVSAALKVDIPAYEYTAAPVLTAGTAVRTGTATATIQFYSSKEGRYYHTVTADGAAVPSIATSGTGSYCAVGWTTVNLSVTLAANDFYVRVKDTAGNVSNILKIDIPAYSQSPAYTAPSYYADGSMGTLYVARNGKTLKVYEGETLENMKKGIGHFTSTSAWDGNVGLAGHNRGAAAYFSFVKDLAIGDRLTYTTPYGSRTYEIYRKDIISETDFSSLYWSAENVLTLITCVENVPEQRYCVQAKAI